MVHPQDTNILNVTSKPIVFRGAGMTPQLLSLLKRLHKWPKKSGDMQMHLLLCILDACAGQQHQLDRPSWYQASTTTEVLRDARKYKYVGRLLIRMFTEHL